MHVRDSWQGMPAPVAAMLRLAGRTRLHLLKKWLRLLPVLLTLGSGVSPALATQTVESGPKEGLPAGAPQTDMAPRSLRADFAHEPASPDARLVADWIVRSGDNRHSPFVLVDKADARVYVFSAEGRIQGAAPALLGLATGDHAVPGIGERKLSSIRPYERTTPAGRFVASLGRNLKGSEILWVDYEGAISMHPVVTSNVKERRAQRLSTPTPLDNRISYGCINVPLDFFRTVLKPAFTGIDGIVYVLPETPAGRQLWVLNDGDSLFARMGQSSPTD